MTDSSDLPPPRSVRGITLRDIADEAGVSTMTVSNVVNGNSSRVSAATTDRILGIVERTGYVASAAARSLVAGSSRLVGLLVPNADDDVLVLSPHSVQVFGVLEREVRARGFHLLFRGVRSPDEVGVAMRTWNLDGVAVLGFHDDEVERLRPVGRRPVVALDSYAVNEHTIGVRSDDREGGRLAAAHLAGLGHRRVAFAGPAATPTGVIEQRLAGFRAGLQEAGLGLKPSDRVMVNPSWDLGVETGRAFADRPEITAVFATADVLAAGLVEGLQQRGRRVPADVSVVGFDDIDLAHQTTPKLTTVRQAVGAKGSAAARILLDEIEGAAAPAEAVILPVELIVRGSSGPAPLEA